ncbi:MAG: SAM-dependent methyltransferase [Candidatus Rokuibacteriota bacterium]
MILIAAACAGVPTGGPDAPFVVTPPELGDAMLRLADVTARDVVYDLGSGDGRIVIQAARVFGARGVGVEIDPRLVRLSRDRALTGGVADRVTILWQDIFVTDIREASVVTLYLGEDVNVRLRPKLLRETRPGTRVVSNTFGMGDWTPDRVERVRLRDGERTLYYWVVPADVAGVWRVALQNGADVGATLTLAQRFQRLTGTLQRDGRVDPIADGGVAGDRIAFGVGRLRFEGRATDDGVSGTLTSPDSMPLGWTARRVR